MAWVISEVTPWGVMGLVALIGIIKPYSGVEVKILFPMVYRADVFHFITLLSTIRCKWSDCYIGPYGVKGLFIFNCSIPPYGVNGRIIILVPTVYRACSFLICSIPPYGENSWTMNVVPTFYRAR